MVLNNYTQTQKDTLQRLYNFFASFPCRLSYAVQSDRMQLTASFGPLLVDADYIYLPIDWFNETTLMQIANEKAQLASGKQDIRIEIVCFIEPKAIINSLFAVA